MGDQKDETLTHLNVRVTSSDSEVVFKIKRSTPLGKLMNSYCERQGKSMDSVRFLFDGTRIKPENTPDELEMEDGDQIEAMVEQQGGSDEAKQPEVKSELHINVKVSSPDSEMYFKIKKTTPLAKLMNTYCERQGKPPGSIRFMLDGVRIENHNTPEELEMEDDDVIDAMITQVGGCL